MAIGRFIGAVGAILAAVACVPAFAETPAELDKLVSAAGEPSAAAALARRQIAAGELLDALATLERMILNHPESDEARLLHAGVMCRLDDRTGALIELDALRNRQISESLWVEANAACAVPQRR